MGYFEKLLLWTLILSIVAAAYLLPSLVASQRRVRGRVLVFLLNTFFGMTGIVWLILLVYASLTRDVEPKPATRRGRGLHEGRS